MKTILYKYQLNTIYDTRKSFYGKTYYFKSNDNSMIILYSDTFCKIMHKKMENYSIMY